MHIYYQNCGRKTTSLSRVAVSLKLSMLLILQQYILLPLDNMKKDRYTYNVLKNIYIKKVKTNANDFQN